MYPDIMHPEIRKFWEKLGHVWVQVEPSDAIPSVPAYWFNKSDSVERVIVACFFDNKMVYWISHSWVEESMALRLIRLKAFL